ncbi:DUF1585 domain-containing protein, partial [Akkermansiaceae bacterium]|nr:DUF1585 domain-containing protein [Akkermansiaceae bacterium]
KPIDASAILPGDIEFSSPAELKTLLMSAKNKFATNMTRKMLSYATGRGLEYYDEAVVTKIVAKLEKSGYSSQTLIHEIVNSRPFLNRSSTR